MEERFDFLDVMKERNFVYKFLTQFHELQSLKNLNYIMNTKKDLQVDIDNPEITQSSLLWSFNNYIVVQDGEILKRKVDFNSSIEALVLSPRRNNSYYIVYLCRAVS